MLASSVHQSASLAICKRETRPSKSISDGRGDSLALFLFDISLSLSLFFSPVSFVFRSELCTELASASTLVCQKTNQNCVRFGCINKCCCPRDTPKERESKRERVIVLKNFFVSFPFFFKLLLSFLSLLGERDNNYSALSN